MATLHKFDALVRTTFMDGEWRGWIDQGDLPTAVRMKLREKFPGDGWAWEVRMDRWIDPTDNGKVYEQTHTLALNDATMPCIVNGNVDYSAWDD